MSKVRVHAEELPPQGGTVALDQAAAKHLQVLRAKVDQGIELFDGKGNRAQAVIRQLSMTAVQCEVAAPEPEPKEPYRLTLVQVLPKAGKIDSMVRMVTEIGVAEVRIVLGEHSVATPDAKSFAKRCSRLERIAEQAARQSGRSTSPTIHPLEGLIEATQKAPSISRAPGILFWEKSTIPLNDALAKLETRQPAHPISHAEIDPTPVWVIVGAEGGISDSEVQKLTSMGFVHASMGPHILRVETAAPVACALLLEGLRARLPAGYHDEA